MKTSKKLWGALALMLIAGEAGATAGYFAPGYGIRAKGRGGVAVAMTDDAMGGANNPATMVWVGSRLDIGAEYFKPIRSAERTGSPLAFSASSDSNNFVIPELGYNRMLSPNMAVGLTIYGNGGMNTDYPGGQINCGAGPANPLCGSGRLTMDMEQLIFAPTFSYKVNNAHSLGIAPLFAYQRFKVDGLQAFTGKSAAPASMTNNGYESSTGAGVRIGYYGRLSDKVSIGVAYATKIRMGKFDKYQGLFADQGDFDIPENYTIGFSVQPVQSTRVSVEYQRINYGKVDSISDSSKTPLPFGSTKGPGFGWTNIDVFKIGFDYDYSPKLTLRGGISHSNGPIQNGDVTMNIIAPAVVQDHATLGFTYRLQGGGEVSMSYMHAFERSLSGPSTLGGTETLRMKQDGLGVAYTYLF